MSAATKNSTYTTQYQRSQRDFGLEQAIRGFATNSTNLSIASTGPSPGVAPVTLILRPC